MTKKKKAPKRERVIALCDPKQLAESKKADIIGRDLHRSRAHRQTYFHTHHMQEYIDYCLKEDEEIRKRWRS